MAGYYGFSKSNNAVDDEADGILPISKLVCAEGKKLPPKFVKDRYAPKRYHHYSKMFNEIDVYDNNEILEDLENNPELKEVLKKYRKKEREKVEFSETYENVNIKKVFWSGSRNYLKRDDEEYLNVTVKRKKDFLYIFRGEDLLFKKKYDANFMWVFTNEGKTIYGYSRDFK